MFSGIEAATVAWHPLGWECVAVAEIEPLPCAVLTHHYPNVPNLGDVTEITEADIAALGEIDVVVFGSPCQDLSVAGHRKGLIDANGNVTRSGLFFTAVNIARWSKARYWLWENVPGAFSSNAGRDFAAVVEFMAGLDEVPVPIKGWGYEGCALGSNGLLEWSVLDAQWFGVAQRRRRVFALLDTGDWRSRPPILLEPEGLRGDSAPSREAGKGSARRAGASVTGDGKKRRELTKTTPRAPEVARCITTREGASYDYETTTMVVHGTQDPCTSSTTAFALGRNNGGENVVGVFYAGQGAKAGSIAYSNDVSPTLKAGNSGTNRAPTIHAPCPQGGTAVAVNIYGGNKRPDRPGGGFYVRMDEDTSKTLDAASGLNPTCSQGGTAVIQTNAEKSHSVRLANTSSNGWGVQEEVTHTLDCTAGPAVQTAMQVRRLTPVECERLQGFPDGYTAVPWRNKPPSECPDGPRYKALGNSMAVPVMRWIGAQIEIAELF